MSTVDSVPFFTAVTHASPGSCTDHLINIVDDYFHLGNLSGKKVVIIPSYSQANHIAVGYKNAKEPSAYLHTTLKITSYLTVLIPLVMLIAKTVLRTCRTFTIVTDGLFCARVEQCWKQFVLPFTIKHGTSSLYIKHFQRHGISAEYPEPLHNLVAKIRKIWADHELDVLPKTEYFRWFEARYDKALQTKKIAMSFTADAFRTDEYTKGERGYGGEWMKEVRRFLWEVDHKKATLTNEEKYIVKTIKAFTELLRKLPPMTVGIRGGSAELAKILYSPLILPLPEFKSKIKNDCTEWENETQLERFLDNILIPRLQSCIKYHQEQYEISVSHSIESKELEFEILNEYTRISNTPSTKFPKLEFDMPTELSVDECIQIQIHQETKTSDRDFYNDSEFEIQNIQDQSKMLVTRKHLSEKTKAKLDEQREIKNLEKDWLEQFECPELAKYL